MPRPDLIAVPDHVPCAGAVAYWTLSGAVPAGALADAWAAAGLDPAWLPEPPTPAVALERALRGKKDKRLLARPLGERSTWAMVREAAEGRRRLDHEPIFGVALDAADEPAFFPFPTGTGPDGPELELADEARYAACANVREAVAAGYARVRRELAATDISSWLVGLAVGRATGVALRPTGGFYFIPYGPPLDLWRRIAGAIGACTGHHLYELPAMEADAAVAAILAAVEREADSEIEEIRADLAKGEIGERAIKSRQGRVTAAADKLAAYDRLLGDRLGGLRARLEQIHIHLAEAALGAAAA